MKPCFKEKIDLGNKNTTHLETSNMAEPALIKLKNKNKEKKPLLPEFVHRRRKDSKLAGFSKVSCPSLFPEVTGSSLSYNLLFCY